MSKPVKNNLKLDKLMGILFDPKKKSKVPVKYVSKNYVEWEIDLITVPTDNGYKYILNCSDLYNRKIDAEPLESKTAEKVIKGITKILERKIISYPKKITCDRGKEFDNTKFKKWCENNNIHLRFLGVNRHARSVESNNRLLVKYLFREINKVQMTTGDIVTTNKWVDNLSGGVRHVNSKRKHKKKITENFIPDKPCKDCFLFSHGDLVHYVHNYPVNNKEDSREIGDFRTEDIRFNIHPKKIERVRIVNMVPMYKLEGIDDRWFRNHDIKRAINKHDYREILDPNKHVLESIKEKKVVGNKIYYKGPLLYYKGEHATVSRPDLLKLNKRMVDYFEK